MSIQKMDETYDVAYPHAVTVESYQTDDGDVRVTIERWSHDDYVVAGHIKHAGGRHGIWLGDTDARRNAESLDAARELVEVVAGSVTR